MGSQMIAQKNVGHAIALPNLRVGVSGFFFLVFLFVSSALCYRERPVQDGNK